MNKHCHSGIPSGCVMQFIKHFHSLNILLTRTHENKYCYLTFRNEACLAFLIFFVQNYWTEVNQSSRHTESYLNFPGHLSLKITFVFFPQLLLVETPLMIVPIRNQICNLRMILSAWFCLLTISLTEGKRILSRRTEKEKIIELSWCQKYDMACDFLKKKTKNCSNWDIDNAES